MQSYTPCAASEHPMTIKCFLCRFFPTAVYLSTSKLAVAAVGNLSFAMALCMYNLVIKVGAALLSCSVCYLMSAFQFVLHHLLPQMLWVYLGSSCFGPALLSLNSTAPAACVMVHCTLRFIVAARALVQQSQARCCTAVPMACG